MTEHKEEYYPEIWDRNSWRSYCNLLPFATFQEVKDWLEKEMPGSSYKKFRICRKKTDVLHIYDKEEEPEVEDCEAKAKIKCLEAELKATIGELKDAKLQLSHRTEMLEESRNELKDKMNITNKMIQDLQTKLKASEEFVEKASKAALHALISKL
jgi:hypothetical protein